MAFDDAIGTWDQKLQDAKTAATALTGLRQRRGLPSDPGGRADVPFESGFQCGLLHLRHGRHESCVMKAVVDISFENGIWAELRIANNDDRIVRIHNPGNYRPTESWEFSYEAYQVAALRSLHFLEMTLRAEDGSVVEPAGIATRADHEVDLPVELEPGAELLIRVPLHEFYDLRRNADYSLALTYGDDIVRVSAAAQVRC